MQAYAPDTTDAAFAASHARFAAMVDWLAGDQAAGMTHAQLEERLHADGLPLLRQLLQDSLDLRAVREQRLAQITDADGHQRGSAEQGRQRLLATVFGQVTVRRIAYRQRGRADLHPPTRSSTCRSSGTPTGYAAWPPWRPPAGRLTTPPRRSGGPPE